MHPAEGLWVMRRKISAWTAAAWGDVSVACAMGPLYFRASRALWDASGPVGQMPLSMALRPTRGRSFVKRPPWMALRPTRGESRPFVGHRAIPNGTSRRSGILRAMLTDRFAEAVLYAMKLHREQVRKESTIPYVTHLFAVCGLVLEDGGTEDEAISALLHDGPEDQGGVAVLNEIRARFGQEVADTVAVLSDAMPAAGEEKAPWRERKEAYLAHLGEASASVLKVSLADKLHNARSILTDLGEIGEAVWDRFNAGRSDQAWYFGALLRVFEARLPGSRNLPDFRRVVGELFGVHPD